MSRHEETLEIAVNGQHVPATLLVLVRGVGQAEAAGRKPSGSPEGLRPAASARPSVSVPGVLFIHGWGGSQEQFLAAGRALADLGCVCLTFDLRGHGRSAALRESVSREDNLRDVVAAYNTLVSQEGVDGSAIAVAGTSYGGYLAAILTSLRPVRWLALHAPALYKDRNWELPKRQLHHDLDLVGFRRRIMEPEENRALSACEAFRGDVLLVESEHDEIVPHPAVGNYLGACLDVHSLTYRVLEGADHGLSEERWRQAYTTILVNWLAEMTAGQRGHPASGGP